MYRMIGTVFGHFLVVMLLGSIALAAPVPDPGGPGVDQLLLKLEQAQGSDPKRVISLSEAVLPLLPEADIGDRSWVMDVRTQAFLSMGAWQRAAETADLWLALARNMGDVRQQARAHVARGIANGNRFRVSEALGDFREGAALAEAAADTGVRANALHNLAMIYGRMGLREQALRLFTEVLSLSDPDVDPEGHAATLNSVGLVFHRIGEDELARRYIREAYELSRKVGYKRGMADARNNLGVLALDEGDLEAAQDAFEASLKLEEELENPGGQGDGLLNLAEVALKSGDLTRAHSLAKSAEQRFDAAQDAQAAWMARDMQAQTLQAAGRLDAAGELCRRLLAAAGGLDSLDDRLQVLTTCGGIFDRLGWYEPAARAWRQVAAIRQQLAERNRQEYLAAAAAVYQVQAAQQQAAVADARLKEQQVQMVIAVVSLLVGLVLLSRLWMVNRRYRELNDRLARLSRTDPLTGLMNRRAMTERLEQEAIRFERRPRPVSVLILDLDHFKSINDTYGHAAGDTVLQAVADTLTQTVRRQDAVARWGGEEFLVLLPDTDVKGATAVGEKIRERVRQLAVSVDGRSIPISVTIGVSGYLAQGWEATIAAADAALYQGKAAGRDRVVVAPGDTG